MQTTPTEPPTVRATRSETASHEEGRALATVVDPRHDWSARFAHGLDHEVRGSIHTILGFAQLVGMDGLTDDQRVAMDWIEDASRRLLTILEGASAAAAAERERRPVPEACDAETIVQTVCQGLAPLARDRAVEVVAEVEAQASVLAAPAALEEAVSRLTDNAVRYSTSPGRVVVAVRRAGPTSWRVEVRDEGPGLSPAQLDRVLEPFMRLPTDEPSAGCGLGLNIAALRVTSLGSSLSIASAPGTGTTCWFDLPEPAPR